MKILIVENDRLSRDLATRVLRAGGYEILCAADGEESILLAIDEQPDLVLMDIGLPGIDGIEAAEVIHEDPRTSTIPIVVLSALVFSADVDRASRAGCADYLTKPIGARELLDRIDEILGRERQLV